LIVGLHKATSKILSRLSCHISVMMDETGVPGKQISRR
jgi:hypothetical protein